MLKLMVVGSNPIYRFLL